MHLKRISVVALLIMLGVSAGGCDINPVNCKNEVVKEVPSPIGDVKAVIFQCTCVTRREVTTRVSVLPLIQQLPKADADVGLVFISNDGGGKTPTYPGGGPVIDVSWPDTDALVIKYPKGAQLLQTSPSIGKILINYEPFAP